jgi:O-acetylhomoserine/O-acetylserine sulfhydrylase-like pyridoxal-dependent enzyme
MAVASTWAFRDTNHAANLFALKELAKIDTMNPIQRVKDERRSALKCCESIQHRSP